MVLIVNHVLCLPLLFKKTDNKIKSEHQEKNKNKKQ